MKIAAQLQALQQQLNAFAQKEGGKCVIAADKSHLFDMLFNAPAGLRVYVMYFSEKARGEFGIKSRTGKVDRTFHVILSKGRGFKIDPATSLTEGSGGGRPMYDLTEDARDVIRTTLLDAKTTERPIDYEGMEPFDAGDLRTDAQQIEFSIGTSIGILSEKPAEEV